MKWTSGWLLFWLFSMSDLAVATTNSQIVAKIFGHRIDQDTMAGVNVINDNFATVRGTDLGAMAVYRGRIYFLLGDTLWGNGGFDGATRNFMMAYSKPLINLNLDNGVELEGYVGGGPTRLMTESGYYIPTALVKINWNGQEHLFSHYMNVEEVGSNDHHIYNSGIAKFNETRQRFEKYKDSAYKWMGSWRHFGMASFWPDYQNGYLYMVGSPSGRFGGVKLARIRLDDFMGTNTNYWEYFMGNGTWSGAINDFNLIKTSVWLIPPQRP